MQGVLQGFRVVGSGSKLGRDYPVVAYRFGGAVELEKLLDYIPASNGERQHLQALMKKSRLSLAEAREKYPDWYERRIVKKECRGRWTVKRDLYDWWLRRIADEIKVGHRFYGIMTLAIYAKKCDIDEDELREDAFGLLQRYDDMSVEDINRFTKDDIVCALEMFNEDYVTFPRDYKLSKDLLCFKSGRTRCFSAFLYCYTSINIVNYKYSYLQKYETIKIGA